MYGEPLAYSPGPGTDWPLHECGVNKWDSSQHVTLNTTKTSFGVPTAQKTHHAVTSWAQSVTVIKSTCVQNKRVAAGIGNCLELGLLRLLLPFLDKSQNNSQDGTFLVVQWTKIHLPMQGTWVQTPIQEDSTRHTHN